MAELAPAGLLDLGCTEYAAAHRLQLELVSRRRGEAGADLFLVTEHRPVFTLGRRGSRAHLAVSAEFLKAREIEVLTVERGGDITYHGPGQLVLYPILHLGQSGLGVAGYVERLEEVMLRLAAASGVKAARDRRNRGVWVGEEKLGSVGIAVRHGVAFHGLALNVNPDLTPFSWINPCGLTGIGMTSLSRVAGRDVSPAEVKKGLAPLLSQLFCRAIQLLPGDKGYGFLPPSPQSR